MDNIDPNLLLGLLSGMNKTGGGASADNSTNDLLLKFLLSGGLQNIMTPKPKEAEPARTINLDDYVRVE